MTQNAGRCGGYLVVREEVHEVLVDQPVVVAQLVVLRVDSSKQAHVFGVVELGRCIDIQVLAGKAAHRA